MIKSRNKGEKRQQKEEKKAAGENGMRSQAATEHAPPQIRKDGVSVL